MLALPQATSQLAPRNSTQDSIKKELIFLAPDFFFIKNLTKYAYITSAVILYLLFKFFTKVNITNQLVHYSL
jgi:hypothetical protein